GKVLADAARGFGMTGAMGFEQILRLLAKLIEVGASGKRARHLDLLSLGAWCPQFRQKEDRTNRAMESSGGLGPFRGLAAPCAHRRQYNETSLALQARKKGDDRQTSPGGRRRSAAGGRRNLNANRSMTEEDCSCLVWF